jgi:predicted permease
MANFPAAWRRVRRAPWFALGASLTFALGVGVNLAVFASLDRLIFRPLPYRDPGQLFLLQQTDLESGQRSGALSARLVAAAAAEIPEIEDMAILGDSSGFFLTPDAEGPELRVSFVTSRMLELGGASPVFGRGFTPEDDRLKRRVMLLTFDAWQARFAGDPDVIGRRLWAFGSPLEIVGVLPAGYIPSGAFIDPNFQGLGLMMTPTQGAGPTQTTLPTTLRLRRGATRASVQQAIDALAARLNATAPASPTGGPQAPRLIPIRDAMFGQYTSYVMLILGGAALVLLAACANLAGLFLARARSAMRATAVRMAIGATRGRLVQDALAECLLVAGAGTAIALLTLTWTMRGLESVLPPIFGKFSAGVDARVVAVGVLAATGASVVAALVPAWILGWRDVWPVVQGVTAPLGAAASRRGRWLLGVEAGLGVLLLSAAAVTARNFTGLATTGLGFDPTDLQSVLVTSRGATAAERYHDLTGALDLVRAHPGVAAAAGAPRMPVLRTGTAPFSAAGPPCCRWHVTGRLVATIGMPLRAGREIADADVAGRALVAMVNDTALAQLFPGTPPSAAIGRTIRFEGEPARELIGVVGDTRRGHDDEPLPGIFVPVDDDPFTGMLIVARVRQGARLPFGDLRRSIDVEGRRTVLYVRPLAQAYGRVLEAPRFRAALFAVFGLVALLIAVTGLFALTSFELADRRRELAVRVALGATRWRLVRLVLVDMARPIGIGLAAGIGLALWAAQFLQAFVHQVDVRDPWTLGAAAVALAVTSAAAAALPAWRASGEAPASGFRVT